MQRVLTTFSVMGIPVSIHCQELYNAKQTHQNRRQFDKFINMCNVHITTGLIPGPDYGIHLSHSHMKKERERKKKP